MSLLNRRTLIRGTAATSAGAMFARPANAAVTEFQPLPSAQDERMKMLVTAAIDAAKSAGATYSGVRLTFSQEMSVLGGLIGGRHGRPHDRNEYMAFGVRARCDGYWGFASSPVWTKDEAARLGRMAAGAIKQFNLLVRDVALNSFVINMYASGVGSYMKN